MKQSLEEKKLDLMLRSSRLVAGGFMGADKRDVAAVITEDLGTLNRLGIDNKKLAERMLALTTLSKPVLGGWVSASENLRVKSEDYKGFLVCPWPHGGRFDKRITTVERSDIRKSISWSDLNMHLIAEHGFFEGAGSAYRLEPRELFELLFDV